VRRRLVWALLGLSWAAQVWADADLALTAVDSPDPVAAGGSLLYTLTVQNNGPATASAVQLTDILPTAVTYSAALTSLIFADLFESGDTSAWGKAANPCSVAGRIVNCSLGDLAAGESAVVELEVVVSASAVGQLSNAAAVGSTTLDPNANNDSATTLTTIAVATADIGLAIIDAPDPVAIGGQLIYTLTVTNFGPDAAPNTELKDALPPELSFLSSTPPCSHQDGFVVCQLGTITSGGSVAVTLRALVGGDAAFAITNPAAASSSATDGNPGNNQDTEITTVSGFRRPRHLN